jgi:hypothetical protein
MPKAKEFDFEKRVPAVDDEDDATLAAIDEGVRDAEAASLFGNALLDHVDLLTRFPRMGSTIRKRSRVRKLLHSPILVY